jgi:sulfur transfer protein SufE
MFKDLIHAIEQSPSWQQRYKLILDAAKNMPAAENLRIEASRVSACTAKTWLSHRQCEQLHYFEIDSESQIIKGLGAILLATFDGKSSAEIQAADLDTLFSRLDLKKHLSPSRSNGFKALFESMQNLSVENR